MPEHRRDSALWGVGHGLSIYLVVAGLTYHWLNNAFFVTISLVFSSERAVWVPFPAIFAVMSVILNFARIKAALKLQPLVDLLRYHDLLLLALLWAITAGFAAISSYVLGRKRVFA